MAERQAGRQAGHTLHICSLGVQVKGPARESGRGNGQRLSIADTRFIYYKICKRVESSRVEQQGKHATIYTSIVRISMHDQHIYAA